MERTNWTVTGGCGPSLIVQFACWPGIRIGDGVFGVLYIASCILVQYTERYGKVQHSLS